MNVLEAIQDPKLFKPFLSGPSWSRWRVALAAMQGLKLGARDRKLAERCTGRRTMPTAPVAEFWAIAGRRSGKTYVLSLVAAFLATCVDYSRYRKPGELVTVLLVAGDRDQARTAHNYILGMLRSQPLLARMIVRETQEEIELANGVLIETVANSYRLIRGRTVAAALLDECAFWHVDGSNPADAVVQSIRPAMLTIPNSLLMVASTPYARRGPVWEAYRRHWGKAGRALIWTAPSPLMNPTLPQEQIDAAYEADPADAASEYGGCFRTDLAALLPREVVEELVAPGVFERPAVAGERCVAFTDPSGGSSDSYTMAIGHRERGNVTVLDLVRERRPPFSPEHVTAEYSEVLKRYGVREVVGDRYSAQWVQEQFRKRQISYRVSDKTKSELYLECLPVFNSGQAELLDNSRLIGQFAGLERRTSRAGKDSVDHGPHGRDDLCNAVAGCLVLAGGRGVGMPEDFDINAGTIVRPSEIAQDYGSGTPWPDMGMFHDDYPLH